MRVGLFCISLEPGNCIIHSCLAILLRLFYHRSNVAHGLEELDCKSFARELLAGSHCPVTVLKVVVLHAAKLLDISVSAMVVGHEKTVS